MASIQFVINAPHSGGSVGITDQQRRAANAHAARMRHAKERRLRMKEYHSRSGGVSDDQRLVLKSGSSERMNACRPQIFSLLSADRRDPFMSSVVALNPIEQGLFDHYINVIIPLMRCTEADPVFANRMKTLWVPCAIAEESLMKAIYLASCRHLAIIHEHSPAAQDSYNRMAFRYKLQVLAALRDSIAVEAPNFTDSAITKAIMLSYDELFVHDPVMLENHVKGAVKMVELRGGPHTLGFNGMLERLLNNLLAKTGTDFGLPIRKTWS